MEIKLEELDDLTVDEAKDEPVIIDDFILFTGVEQDELAENPLNWGSLGKIKSFLRDHCGFQYETNAATLEDVIDELDEEHEEYILLGLFRHGVEVWHRSGVTPFGTEVDYRWDGTRHAAVWIPCEGELKEVDDLEGAERAKKLAELCDGDLEIWNAWRNGAVRLLFAELFSTLRTPDGEAKRREGSYVEEVPVVSDSVGGLYGDEDVQMYFDSFKERIRRELSPEPA